MPSFPLTQDQIDFYRREGYLVVPRLLGAPELAKAEAAIANLTEAALTGKNMDQILELEPEPVDGKHVPRRLYNPFENHSNFRDLATGDRVLDAIESLVGPDIQIQHSKLNMKPAKVGSVVDWHQDMAYFPHTNDDVVTALIYLDDASETNGCLQVVPRHHHHYFNHFLPDGTFAGMITEDMAGGTYGKPIPLSAPAGSAIFMHCITPHSSLPNKSDRARRTLIFEYRAADAFPIYSGDNTVKSEKLSHQVRGKRHQYARLGGPPPVMPISTAISTPKFNSLFERQAYAKAALTQK